MTAHSVTVTGLTPLTAYHFRVKSSDGCHETDSDDVPLTTTDILKPDLEVTSLTFPATVKAHDQISVSWTVLNGGPGDTTAPWNDAVYLSPTATLDPKTATLLGTYSNGLALAMGATYTQTQTISLPGLSAGAYYLIVVTDSDNTVAEADETNNGLAMPLTFLKVQMLIAAPSQTALSLTVGIPQAVTLNLSSLSDAPMTGITATVEGAAPNVQVQVTPPSSLAPMAGDTVQINVTAADDSVLSDPVIVHLTDQQGDTAQATLNLSVLPNKPNLTASPSPITQGMVRGQQTLVEVTLTNTGAAAATGLNISLPSAPWLTLASPSALGDLASGASARIVLLLAPDGALPLGAYTGVIAVNGTNASIPISYTFTNISTAKGDLKVTSSDEFTYFASDHPPLADAAVTLTDPTTGATVLTGTTDDQGEFFQQGVIEGNYNIEVTSSGHAAYRNSVQITANKETDVSAFLSRQLVTYQWTVIPVDLQDDYVVQLTPVFSANVPAPVVTISPKQLDLSQLAYDQNGKATVYFTVTNHGLIAADDTKLTFPDRSDYSLSPAVGDLGKLDAMTTIVVPVTVARLSPSGTPHAVQGRGRMGEVAKPEEAADPCTFQGLFIFSYLCGVKVQNSDDVDVTTGLCGALERIPPPEPPAVTDDPFVPIPPNNNNDSGVTGPDVIIPHGNGPPPALSQPFFCDPCTAARLDALVNAYISLTPAQDCIDAYNGIFETSDLYVAAQQDPVKYVQAVGKAVDTANSGSKCAAAVGEAFESGGLSLVIPDDVSPDQIIQGAEKILHACDGLPSSNKFNNFLTNLDTHLNRYYPVIDAFVDGLGDAKWFSGKHSDSERFNKIVDRFDALIDRNADAPSGNPKGKPNLKPRVLKPAASNPPTLEALRISDAERQELLALPLPSQLTSSDINKLVDRWNRTVDYAGAGIYNLGDVPPGQSTDFIAHDKIAADYAAAAAAIQADRAEGITDPAVGLSQTEQALQQAILDPQSAGTCAEVRLQLDQTVAITRTAFKATLQLDNSAQNVPLTGIKVALKITDQAGNDRTSLFVISAPTATGFNAVDGTGTLATGTTGTASWTILPAHIAAANGVTQYFVSGEIDYSQSGTTISIPLFPTGITVVPDPSLRFHYFLQKQVYSDDPFTPQIEPAEPFSLGLLVVNAGMGTARNLTITSSKPRIIDNVKGLDIAFSLIGTQVNEQPVSPTLTVNLGSVAPDGGTAVADFLLTSSLAGQFVSETASFNHVDGLGNSQTSLIDSVDIHSLEHVVRVDVPTDDGKPDFLADDIPDADSLPDTLWNSDGTTAPVTAITNAAVDGAVTDAHLQVHLNAPPTTGWVYLRMDDPAQGKLKLLSVVRSDGHTIRLDDNAWTTSRLIHLQGQPPYQQNRLYLFDKDTTGSYTLLYAQKDPVDEPLGSLKTLPDGTQVTFGAAPGGTGTGTGSGGSTGTGTGAGLSGPVAVTAAFPDALYLEATDRSSGIKAILGAGLSIPLVGDLVTGAGTVRTGADGERYLDVSALSDAGSGPVTPLEITTKGFYGADSIGYDPSTGAGQKGMAGGAGLDPVGLLAATLGRVTEAGGGALTLDDGYGRPIKTLLPAGVPAPAVGTFVAAAGLVSLERHPDGLYPVLRLRNAADLAADLSGLQGGFLSPANTLLVGDNLFSLPGLPAIPAPPSVLSGIDPGDGSALVGRLTRYDAPTQSEVFWDGAGVAGPFGDFLLGEGYRLTLRSGESGQIGFGGFRTDFADQWISLPTLGTTRIGTPFPVPIDWSQVLVTDGTKTVPLRDAAQAEFPPWLNSKAQYFDAATQTNKTLGLPEDGPDSTALVPWRGYWVTGMKDQLALIVPAHAGLPTALSLSPSTALAGGPGLTLMVTGTNFTSGSLVRWNGMALPTVWVSPTQLTAAVPASALIAPGVASVTVLVPGPYGGESAPPLPFTVTAPPPVLISLTVPSPVSGGLVLTATVTLSEPAPSDTVVGLSSSDSSVVRVHRSVIVAAGSVSGTFAINTYRSHVTKTVTIQASLGPVVLTAPLTITGR